MTGTEEARRPSEGAGISVILPAYNDDKYIREIACETAAVLDELDGDHEIIIVDDGSTDGSHLEIARAASELKLVKSITLVENQGKGRALIRGFQESRKDLVCFLDADPYLHPSQLKSLLSRMDETGADIVLGSKRHPESRLDYPWYRKVLSTVYSFLILLLFRVPLRDTQTGIKVFRREVLTKCYPRLVAKLYTLDLELLVVAHRIGYSIAEAPIDLAFQGKYGGISWASVRDILLDTLGIFYRVYFLRYYDSPLKPVVGYEPRISIVLPARDLDPMTEECIRKCHQLNYTNFDIKFIPDEPTKVELRPPGSEVIASGPVGPAVKRNIGGRSGPADIIAFIDADAWPETEWLKNAVPYFEDEKVAAVCGPAVTPLNDSRRQQASGYVYSSTLVSGSTTYRYSYHALREVNDYPSSNLLVRRNDFDEVGGFPEEYWPGEDTILCLRLIRDLGKKILYIPNVIVRHHRRPVYMPHLRQIASYSEHRGFFVRKFPETSRKFQYFVPSIFVLSLVILLPLSFAWRPFLYAYVSLLGMYFLLCLLSSIKSTDPVMDLIVFPGIIASHITYGVGFIKGLFARRLER